MDFHDYNKVIDNYIKRYSKNEVISLNYIFFEKSIYENSIENFLKFAKIALKKSNVLKNKIKVILIKEEAPKFSLFVGHKKNFNLKQNNKYTYSIIYINDKPFVNSNGVPNLAFVSVDEDLNNIMLSYAKQVFHQNNNVFTIEEFIKHYK